MKPATHGVDKVAVLVADKLEEVKPVLRGWIHTGMIPLLTAAFAVLIVLSPTPLTRLGSSIYAACAILLFGVSGIYHRGNWSPKTLMFWKRFDHVNIYIFIAGSYTPLAFMYLEGKARWILCGIVWACACAGSIFKIMMPHAPRWISVPLYMALGWIAVGFTPAFIDGAKNFPTWVNVSCLTLVAIGGLLYTIGGIVYGLRRPNPAPKVFGFHEIFHAFTAVAFVCQYVGVTLATYSLQ